MLFKLATLSFLLAGGGGDYRIIHVKSSPTPDAVRVGEVFGVKIKYSSVAILSNWKIRVRCDSNIVCLSPISMPIAAPASKGISSLDLSFKGANPGISECEIVVSAEDNINGTTVPYNAATNFSINVQQ